MMVIIKNKKLFIFILFTLVIFVTSFKKLVESSSEDLEITEADYQVLSKEKGNAVKPLCLSVRCDRPVNFNFNADNQGNTYDTGGDLAAYCCKACRDSGGLDHENCLVNGGNCNTNNTIIVEGMNDNCEGIIHNGENTCYSVENNDGMNDNLGTPESCGPSSFYNCFQDPSCVNYMNNINMSSYEVDEPQKNENWQSNITNMLSFSYFNDLNGNTDEDGGKGKTLNGNFCNELCIKAGEVPPNDENGINLWNDLQNRLVSDDPNIKSAANCELSNAIWRSKMLCNGCRMFMNDEDGNNLLTNDPNYRKISCHAGADYDNTKQIQDLQSITTTDENGDKVFKMFKANKNDDGTYQDLQYVDDDIGTPDKISNGTGVETYNTPNRTVNDIQVGCRLNCAYDMKDKCFNDTLNSDEIHTIKTQCKAACKKRLPAWTYYASAIGSDDEIMESDYGWLKNTDNKPWKNWSEIFSPDQ